MTDHPSLLLATREPRLYGVIDVMRADRVAGWVIDRTDAAHCASVEIRREGRLVGTVTANRQRKDLERQAVGTGYYGFSFSFDPPLEEGMNFTIEVKAMSNDGVELLLQPVGRAAESITPEKRVLNRILGELSALRADVMFIRQEITMAEQRRLHFQERLELVQLRLESSLSDRAAPRNSSPRWLGVIVVAGAIIAAVSLCTGLLSLWTT